MVQVEFGEDFVCWFGFRQNILELYSGLDHISGPVKSLGSPPQSRQKWAAGNVELAASLVSPTAQLSSIEGNRQRQTGWYLIVIQQLFNNGNKRNAQITYENPFHFPDLTAAH